MSLDDPHNRHLQAPTEAPESRTSQLLSVKVLNIWFGVLAVFLLSVLALIYFDDIDAMLKQALGVHLGAVWRDVLTNLMTSMITLLFVGVYFEKYIRNESTALFLEKLFDTRIILNDLSDERVAEIGKAALSRVFEDTDFGYDVFTSLQKRIRRTNERAHQYHARMVLRQSNDPDIASTYFEVINIISYKKIIRQTVLEFKITDSLEEWEDTMIDRKVECSYLLRSPDDIGEKIEFTEKHFSVSNVYLDEESLPIARKELNKRVYYVSEIPEKFRKTAKLTEVRYIFRSLIRKTNHLIAQGPVVPTKGIRISLNYADTDIGRVAVMPFFSSAGRALFVSVPQTSPIEKEVIVDGWVLPRSGVTFVWSLNGEIAVEREARSRLPLTDQTDQQNQPVVRTTA